MRGVRYLDNMQVTYMVRAWRQHVQGRRRRAVVGRCRLTVSKSMLKPRLVSALEAKL